MNFAELVKNQATKTTTLNGEITYSTSGSACVDLFAQIGSLRNDPNRAIDLFEAAYREDPLTATKIVFYARDIREGLGERYIPRMLFAWMSNHHKEAMWNNIRYIGEYGRFDDLYVLDGFALEEEMYRFMKEQFKKDLSYLAVNDLKDISLLAKWIKSADASSKETRKLGIKTAMKLGYNVYTFKRMVKQLRKALKIVERDMSANNWGEINYSAVPSKAATLYRNAFLKHDPERYSEFVDKAVNGEVKINSATLYPYDIVGKFNRYMETTEKKVLEAQWKQLPNYVEEGQNIMIMADVSGSMTCCGGLPMASAVGLAIYFAERNIGDYHNLFMTFSGSPTIISLDGHYSLEDKISFVKQADWGQNTDIAAAFKLILDIAVHNHTPQEEIPKAIVIISDMEFDYANGKYNPHHYNATHYEKMKAMYESHDYTLPNIVYWNVNSNKNTLHAKADIKGVQMCSGHSASTFKLVTKCINMTPYQMMREVIDSPRYQLITLAE